MILLVASVYATIAFLVTYRLCGDEALKKTFVDRHLAGKDLHKPTRPMLAESFGVIAGLVYLISLFLFIPVRFLHWENQPRALWQHYLPKLWPTPHFPYDQLATYLSALLSLTCMIFLGFADDVLDMRWRVKIWLPAVASIPLLMVYYVTYGGTQIVVPLFLRSWLGCRLLDLGGLYYTYMAMVAVFCTHSINILAGINGIEVGQSLVICLALILNDLCYLLPAGRFIVDAASWSPEASETHLFSLCLLLPFFAVSLALFQRNRFPAQVFVGDTYCYFAGMTFAVVGILGHFSKTLLLFFLPQILNFILSCPQLFRFVPCPRHRLPRFEPEDGLLYPSEAALFDLKEEADKPGLWRHRIGAWILWLLSSLGCVRLRGRAPTKAANRRTVRFLYTWSGQEWTHTTNLTWINAVLVWTGPRQEGSLLWRLLGLQAVVGCALPFFIRYGLVHWFY